MTEGPNITCGLRGASGIRKPAVRKVLRPSPSEGALGPPFAALVRSTCVLSMGGILLALQEVP